MGNRSSERTEIVSTKHSGVTDSDSEKVVEKEDFVRIRDSGVSGDGFRF